MTIERKVGMGIAGQPSGGAADVAEVFSTYLYTGTGATRTITNGIDLAGEGGLVWIKGRNQVYSHQIFDTERGATQRLEADGTGGQVAKTNSLTSFNSNGFSLGSENDVNSGNPYDFASFTFRKKSGFFDCVTYSGNGVHGRAIAHGLNGPVGMIIIKRTDAVGYWATTHKNSAPLTLNTSLEDNNTASVQNGYAPPASLSETTFTLYHYNSNLDAVNASGATYVAYLFADNSAEDADDQMIKCGSYTGNGSIGHEINLGWEPQFIIQKHTSGASNWQMYDSMRGVTTGGNDARLYPNLSNAEDSSEKIEFNSTGFSLMSTSGHTNQSGQSYIYMAIRAPMMKEPEAATDVFAIDTIGATNGGTLPSYVSGFPVDMLIQARRDADNNMLLTRLLGETKLFTNLTNGESAESDADFDYQDGVFSNTSVDVNRLGCMWKRAKGFFDVVATKSLNSSVNHNLGVTPELVIYKRRDTTYFDWYVCSTANGFGTLNTTAKFGGTGNGAGVGAVYANATATTVSGGYVFVGSTSADMIIYLFASLDGISKFGSYTGNGSNQTIDCGFSAGSRFILIKRTDAVGDWYFWDSARGIVAGNDPHLSLNTTAAEVTSDDSVDPANSGFIVNQVSATNINVSSGTYIFYAIA